MVKAGIGLFAVLAGGLITWMIIDRITTSSEVKKARVSIRYAAREPLDANSRTLQLTVGGVDTCSPAKKPDEVERLRAEQADREIVVRASLRIYEGELNCEVTTANKEVDVNLDRSLGDRLIIDDSRGEHRVISSPAIRAELLRSSRRSVEEAQRFVRGRFPQGEGANCTRGGNRGFFCTYHEGRHVVFIQAFVLPNGRFGAAPLGTAAGIPG